MIFSYKPIKWVKRWFMSFALRWLSISPSPRCCLGTRRASERALRALWCVLCFRWAVSGPASKVIVTGPVQTLATFGQTPLQRRVADCTEPHSELHTHAHYCTNIWWQAETHKTLTHEAFSNKKQFSCYKGPSPPTQMGTLPRNNRRSPNLDKTHVSMSA